MDEINQRLTSAASAGFHKPTGVMNSAFDTGAKVPKQRGGTRTQLPPLDASQFEARKGLALPPSKISARGKTKYDSIFDKLTADDMGVPDIPLRYMHALKKAAQTYEANRPALKRSRLVVRRIDDTTCGVWREARKEPAK